MVGTLTIICGDERVTIDPHADWTTFYESRRKANELLAKIDALAVGLFRKADASIPNDQALDIADDERVPRVSSKS